MTAAAAARCAHRCMQGRDCGGCGCTGCGWGRPTVLDRPAGQLAGHAAAAVVDLADGMTFVRGADGHLFDEDTATTFARVRNGDVLPAYRTYRVVTLTMTSYTPPAD